MEAILDWDEFGQRAIDPRDSSIYFKVRRELLTPKYILIDHGIQAFLIGVLLLFIHYRFNGKLYAVSSHKSTITLAIILPFFTVASFLFDLLQGQARWEFPPWADSIAIPLLGLPITLIILLIVSALVMLFSKRSKTDLLEIREAFHPRINPILAIFLLAVIALTALSVYEGKYWFSVPTLLWAYYIGSVAAQRKRFKIEDKSDTPSSPRPEA